MLEAWPIGPIELLDVIVLWVALWAGIVWLRSTPARLLLPAIALLGGSYLVARQVGLVMIAWLLQGFSADSLLVLVVVFQPELRRLFEQLASLWPLRRRSVATGTDEVDVLVRSLTTLAEQRQGALVVIEGREAIESHVDGGVPLDARISEPLLLSLFDPHSPGHDGAVVLESDRLVRFAVHLPLSTDRSQLGQRGTRHAAALGLSERCDALCIVVSEERGTVAIAQDGRLETLSSPRLAAESVRAFLAGLSSAPTAAQPTAVFFTRWREAAVASVLAVALWLLVVPGSSRTEVEREVALEVTGLPKSFVLESIQPESARIRLTGLRRDLFLVDPDSMRVRVDAILVDLGRRTFQIGTADVDHPDSVEVVSVDPTSVKISVRRESADEPPPEPGR